MISIDRLIPHYHIVDTTEQPLGGPFEESLSIPENLSEPAEEAPDLTPELPITPPTSPVVKDPPKKKPLKSYAEAMAKPANNQVRTNIVLHAILSQDSSELGDPLWRILHT